LAVNLTGLENASSLLVSTVDCLVQTVIQSLLEAGLKD